MDLGVSELWRDELLRPVHVSWNAELLAEGQEDRVPINLPPADRRSGVRGPTISRIWRRHYLSQVSRSRVMRSRRPSPLRDKMSHDSACESPIILSPMNVHLQIMLFVTKPMQ